jgi:hypothetical protein
MNGASPSLEATQTEKGRSCLTTASKPMPDDALRHQTRSPANTGLQKLIQ